MRKKRGLTWNGILGIWKRPCERTDNYCPHGPKRSLELKLRN